jgi:nitric oxide reductase subunit B
MLIITAIIFTVGVALFIVDYFRYAPRLDVVSETGTTRPSVRPAAV